MIDKRVGFRMKEYREKLGMTQEAFAEKIGVPPGYISTVERGITFPRYEKLIAIINALGVTADAIFCDVLESTDYKENILSERLAHLTPESRLRILQVVDLMIQQETNSK